MEFKDKKKGEDFLRTPSLDAILDEELIEKKTFLDDVKVEEDSYKACVAFLLLNMASAYIELRHYSEAMECLLEAEEISEDKVADVFFRKSQVRTYNKYSDEEQLDIALDELEKALKINQQSLEKRQRNFGPEEENIILYNQHRDIILKTKETKISEKMTKIKGKS